MRIADVHLSLSTGNERADLVSLALAAEELGYGGVWITELAARDAFVVLTEIALKTRRIELGSGIVNHYGRSPATLAQATATLSEILEGRPFNLGLGASSRLVIEGFHGLPFDRPYRRMAETIALVRLALAGERIDFDGEVFRTGRFRLGVAPKGPVRLYVAGFARPMLAVTGQHADGWLPNLPSRRGLGALRSDVAQAAEQAGRPVPTTAAYISVTVGDDPAEIEEPHRRTIAWYISSGGEGYRTLFRRYGYDQLVDDVVALWSQGRRDEARALVTPEVIRDIGIAGPVSAVPEQLERFAAVGIDIPVLRLSDALPADEQVKVLREIAGAFA